MHHSCYSMYDPEVNSLINSQSDSISFAQIDSLAVTGRQYQSYSNDRTQSRIVGQFVQVICTILDRGIPS